MIWYNDVMLEENCVLAWTSWVVFTTCEFSCTTTSSGFIGITWFKSVSIDWAWVNVDDDEMFNKSLLASLSVTVQDFSTNIFVDFVAKRALLKKAFLFLSFHRIYQKRSYGTNQTNFICIHSSEILLNYYL